MRERERERVNKRRRSSSNERAGKVSAIREEERRAAKDERVRDTGYLDSSATNQYPNNPL